LCHAFVNICHHLWGDLHSYSGAHRPTIGWIKKCLSLELTLENILESQMQIYGMIIGDELKYVGLKKSSVQKMVDHQKEVQKFGWQLWSQSQAQSQSTKNVTPTVASLNLTEREYYVWTCRRRW
jgi:hypothetical protein